MLADYRTTSLSVGVHPLELLRPPPLALTTRTPPARPMAESVIAAGGAGSLLTGAAEEQTEFDVILTAIGDKKINVIVQFSLKKHPELRDVVTEPRYVAAVDSVHDQVRTIDFDELPTHFEIDRLLQEAEAVEVLHLDDGRRGMTAAGQRKFGVKVEGTTVLDNFDIIAAAGLGLPFSRR